MTDAAERAAVVTAAKGWLGTRYHPCARVKGAGVDCLTLIAAAYEEAGVITDIDLPPYAPDWHLHRSEERYMEGVLQYAREIEGPPGPGDIVLWRFGRCFSHGAVVIDWPLIVHAYVGQGCVLEDAERASWLNTIGENTGERGNPRPRKFFSRWGA